MASNAAARFPGSSAPTARRRFLSPHQAAVLEAAIRHLMPAAYEADVVSHLDRLLAQFDAHAVARRVRVADLRDQCTNGIALLDQLAGGDFTAAPPLRQSLLVAHAEAAPFASLLFDHFVEAMYAPPEKSRRDGTDRHRETG